MNSDPLAEEFYSYSPYNAMMNNPLSMIDPTGMAAEWIPEVDGETGGVTYTAEAGDSAKSLSDQYGITQTKAEAMTGTKGNAKIEKGTSISGETVAKNNGGSNVLKLDTNDSSVTKKDIVSQAIFAVRNESVIDDLQTDISKIDNQGSLNDYFTFSGTNSVRQYEISETGFLNINILGNDLKINFGASLQNDKALFSTFNGSDRQTFISKKKGYQNNLGYNHPSNGKTGFKGMSSVVLRFNVRGRNQHVFRSYLEGKN